MKKNGCLKTKTEASLYLNKNSVNVFIATFRMANLFPSLCYVSFAKDTSPLNIAPYLLTYRQDVDKTNLETDEVLIYLTVISNTSSLTSIFSAKVKVLNHGLFGAT